MNRIEDKLAELGRNGKKALITYMTAGLPDMEGTKNIIRIQEEAGADMIELGIPFSDPVADGPEIQAASYEAILRGSNIYKAFEMMSALRKESEIPVIFKLYYNTILHYGVEAFVDKCAETGVDGLIIPDLPKEEQGELSAFLIKEDAPIIIQMVSSASKQRLPQIFDGARGFVSYISSVDIASQDGRSQKEADALKEIKAQSKLPVMIGFGGKEADDISAVSHIIDGVIADTCLVERMKETEYRPEAVTECIRALKQKL